MQVLTDLRIFHFLWIRWLILGLLLPFWTSLGLAKEQWIETSHLRQAHNITDRIPFALVPVDKTATQVLQSSTFNQPKPVAMQLGYHDEALWLKLAVRNDSSQVEERWLDFPISRWSEVEIHGPFQTSIATVGQLQSIAAYHHLLLHLKIEAGAEAIWLLKIRSPYSLQWSVDILGQDQLMKRKESSAWWMGVYLGMTLFAVGFFLTVALETRSRLAVDLLVLMIAFNLGFVPAYLGYHQRLEIGGSWLADRSLFFCLCLTAWSSFRLIGRHMAISDFYRLVMKCISFLTFPLALLACFMWNTWVTMSAIVFGLLTMGCSLFILLARSLQGSRLAILLGLAWAVAGGSYVIYILAASNVISYAGFEFLAVSMSPILLFGGVFALWMFSIALADDYRTLQLSVVSVENKKEKLEQTLKSAQAVQATFIQGDCDAGPYSIRSGYFPCEETGGDWLGYRYDPQHRMLYLAIADVDGHGVAAALVAGSIHGAFYSEILAAESESVNPEHWMRSMVDHLHKIVHITDRNNLRSATFAGCCLDFRRGKLHYVNAGHTPVLLVRRGQVQTLFTVGSPLGFSEEPILGELSYPLEVGDRILMFTDGILQGSEESMKPLRLEDLAQCIKAEDSLDACKQRIEAMILRTQERADDCTFVLCEYRHPND